LPAHRAHRMSILETLIYQNPALTEGPLWPFQTLSFIVSRLERLPSSDGVVPALLHIVEPLIVYLFVQLNLAANANESSRVRHESLRKLKAALRTLRPAGRPDQAGSRYFEVSEDWPIIVALHQQFVALMVWAYADLDENSAHEAVQWLRRGLQGDQDALECVRTYSPDFLKNALGLDANQREAFFSSLAKIKRPRGPLRRFATCAVSAKYGMRRRAAERVIRELLHFRPCPF
jgi:hypothetical protein